MKMEHVLLKFYESEFVRLGIRPYRRGTALPHVAWMVESMLSYVEASQGEEAECDYGKVNSWLGFVQGVCWKEGLYDLDQLRAHVIDAKENAALAAMKTELPVPFDFTYVLERHSGLVGWVLVSGRPENFVPG